MESNISAKEQLMKSEDDKLREHIDKVEADNVKQDEKIEKLDGRIDKLKDNHASHSEILEAILKELKEKDKVSCFSPIVYIQCISIADNRRDEQSTGHLDEGEGRRKRCHY